MTLVTVTVYRIGLSQVIDLDSQERASAEKMWSQRSWINLYIITWFKGRFQSKTSAYLHSRLDGKDTLTEFRETLVQIHPLQVMNY